MIRKYIVKCQVVITVIQKVTQEQMGYKVWGEILDSIFYKNLRW